MMWFMVGPVDSMVVCPLLYLLQYKMVLLVKEHVIRDHRMTNQTFCESLNSGTGGGGSNCRQENKPTNNSY